jgi:lipopolysaccharide export LptBFGC system permease protein LptF
MATAPQQGEIKRNVASLVGGIVIAIGVFILWVLVTGTMGYAPTWPVLALGALVAAAAGIWVRVADL